MKKIFIVLVAVSLGVCSIAGCTQSDNNTSSTPSEQSQSSKQVSNEPSEESQNSEQTSDTSSEQSQNSEQTSNDESSFYSEFNLDTVKDIIAKNDNFDNIYSEIKKAANKEPDRQGKSNISWFEYDIGERKIYHDFNERISIVIFDKLHKIYLDTYSNRKYKTESIPLYQEDSSKLTLTLDDVKDIIAKNDNISDMHYEIRTILQKNPDSEASEMYRVSYKFSEDETEQIMLNEYVYDSAADYIYYVKWDSNGKIISKEKLYGIIDLIIY